VSGSEIKGNPVREQYIHRLLNMLNYYSDTFARLPLTDVEEVYATILAQLSSILRYRVCMLLLKDHNGSFILRVNEGSKVDLPASGHAGHGMLEYLWHRVDMALVIARSTLEADLLQAGQQVEMDIGESLIAVPLKAIVNYRETQIGLVIAAQPYGNHEPDIDKQIMEVITSLAMGAIASCTELAERKRVEAELTRYRDHLKELVDERTQELSQALEELRTTQHQLVESAKMASLGELVAGVAHEINTPVGVAVTATSSLHTRAQKLEELYKSGAMKRSHLEEHLKALGEGCQIVLNNLQRASNLVRSFKEVAVDQSSEQKRTFALKGYLEEILTSMQPKFKRTKYHISISCDENIILLSYPGAIAQVVTNLLMNSLIHGFENREEGRISIEAKTDLNSLTLHYHDDGNGVSSDILPKIFNPFFTSKRGSGSSGLGLHIVYNLVTQKLKGTIRCESTAGHGVLFIISMPLERVEE